VKRRGAINLIVSDSFMNETIHGYLCATVHRPNAIQIISRGKINASPSIHTHIGATVYGHMT
jgi:hypothetical protein